MAQTISASFYKTYPNVRPEKILDLLQRESVGQVDTFEQEFLSAARLKFNDFPAPVPRSPQIEMKETAHPTLTRAGAGAFDFIVDQGPVLVGGAIGAGLGVPGGPPGVIGGAMLGGAGGEALKQVFNPKSSSSEAATEIAEAATFMGLGEAGPVAAGAIKGGPAIAKTLGAELVSPASRRVPLTPSEKTGSAGMQFFESVAEKSIPAAGVFNKFREAQQKALIDDLSEGVANKISTTNVEASQIGILFRRSIEEGEKVFKDKASALYGEIDDIVKTRTTRVPVTKEVPSRIVGPSGETLTVTKRTLEKSETGGVQVSTQSLKKVAIPLLRRIKEQEKLIPPAELARTRGILERIVNSPKSVNFQTFQDSRSTLVGLTRQISEQIPGKQGGITKLLSKETDSAMMKAAEDSGIPGLVERVRNANSFYRQGVETYNSKVIEGLMEQSPEKVAKLLRSGTLDDVKLVQSTVPDADFQVLKARLWRDLINDASQGELKRQIIPGVESRTGIQVLNFKSLTRSLERLGAERVNIVFNRPGETEAIAEFISTAERVGKKSLAPGLANSLIAWSTNGFIIYTGGRAALTGDIGTLASVGALSLGLNASARLMTNPEGIKLLTQAIKTPPGTRAATQLSIRLFALAMRPEQPTKQEEPTEEER